MQKKIRLSDAASQPTYDFSSSSKGGSAEALAKSPEPPQASSYIALLSAKLLTWGFGLWTVCILLFLYSPILLLIIYSFNDARYGIEWRGFTLRWYEALFGNRLLIDAFRNSLIVGSLTTIVSTLLGTTGAWLMYRYRFPFEKTLGALIFIPVVIPEVLMGAGLLLLFVSAGIERGFLTMIIAHTTFCFPFVMIVVRARLEGIDPHLEEAALDLGARPFQAFALVVLPCLLPAVFAGALMAFTLSLDEYIVTLFTVGAADTQTLPLAVFPLVKKGQTPQLNALSALFISGTILLVILSEIIRRLASGKSSRVEIYRKDVI